jgi:hypothetical protein
MLAGFEPTIFFACAKLQSKVQNLAGYVNEKPTTEEKKPLLLAYCS